METVPLQWAELIRRQARKSPMRYQHGGFVLYKGKVICVGYNQRLRKGDTSNHVERVLRRKIPKGIDPADCTLVIGRLAGQGPEFGNSRPCSLCTPMLTKFGFGLILHT